MLRKSRKIGHPLLDAHAAVRKAVEEAKELHDRLRARSVVIGYTKGKKLQKVRTFFAPPRDIPNGFVAEFQNKHLPALIAPTQAISETVEFNAYLVLDHLKDLKSISSELLCNIINLLFINDPTAIVVLIHNDRGRVTMDYAHAENFTILN